MAATSVESRPHPPPPPACTSWADKCGLKLVSSPARGRRFLTSPVLASKPRGVRREDHVLYGASSYLPKENVEHMSDPLTMYTRQNGRMVIPSPKADKPNSTAYRPALGHGLFGIMGAMCFQSPSPPLSHNYTRNSIWLSNSQLCAPQWPLKHLAISMMEPLLVQPFDVVGCLDNGFACKSQNSGSKSHNGRSNGFSDVRASLSYLGPLRGSGVHLEPKKPEASTKACDIAASASPSSDLPSVLMTHSDDDEILGTGIHKSANSIHDHDYTTTNSERELPSEPKFVQQQGKCAANSAGVASVDSTFELEPEKLENTIPGSKQALDSELGLEKHPNEASSTSGSTDDVICESRQPSSVSRTLESEREVTCKLDLNSDSTQTPNSHSQSPPPTTALEEEDRSHLCVRSDAFRLRKLLSDESGFYESSCSDVPLSPSDCCKGEEEEGGLGVGLCLNVSQEEEGLGWACEGISDCCKEEEELDWAADEEEEEEGLGWTNGGGLGWCEGVSGCEEPDDYEWDEEDDTDEETAEPDEDADSLWQSFENCMLSPLITCTKSPTHTSGPNTTAAVMTSQREQADATVSNMDVTKHREAYAEPAHNINTCSTAVSSSPRRQQQASLTEPNTSTTHSEHISTCRAIATGYSSKLTGYSSKSTGYSSKLECSSEDGFVTQESTEAKPLEQSCNSHEVTIVCPSSRLKSTKKRVHFPEGPEISTVHEMVAWGYAYRAARKGPWEQYARDRSHFRRRVEGVASLLEPCLSRKVAEIKCAV